MSLPSFIEDRTHEFLGKGRGWYQTDAKNKEIITVHHTASTKDGTEDEILGSIYATHHGKHDWPGISYQYFYIPERFKGHSGQFLKLNNDEDVTWHDSSNWDSIGVCIHGYYHPDHNQTLTEKDLAIIAEMLSWLCEENPQFPATYEDVLGHRERSATACPGDYLFPFVEEYREQEGLVDWGAIDWDAELGIELGFDHTKRLPDDLWELFNFNEAIGLPRKTAVDSVHKEWNSLIKQIENAPTYKEQLEVAVNKAVEKLQEKHEKEMFTLGDTNSKALEQMQNMYETKLAEATKYDSNPNTEALKEIGRWLLFTGIASLFTFGLELIPGLELEPQTKVLFISVLSGGQRYFDKLLHENWKAEKREAEFLALSVGEVKKVLSPRGLAPF